MQRGVVDGSSFTVAVARPERHRLLEGHVAEPPAQRSRDRRGIVIAQRGLDRDIRAARYPAAASVVVTNGSSMVTGPRRA